MTAGIIYSVETTSKKGPFTEHSLLSSVSTIQENLEEMGYDVVLFEGQSGMDRLCRNPSQVSFVIDYIPWTRTNQKICSPSMLNFYHIPIVGNESDALVLCADKILTKLLANMKQIPTPQFVPLPTGSAKYAFYDVIRRSCKIPFMLKANRTSGSLGVRLIRNEHDYFAGVDELTALWGDHLFAEEYVDGIDITVPVLSVETVPTALGTTEYLDSNRNRISFFSHDYKYHEKVTCINFHDDVLTPQMLNYAATMHQMCRCTSMSRVDFRVSKNGEVFFLEINATPELNKNGAFSVAGSGRTLSEVLQVCINEALHNNSMQT